MDYCTAHFGKTIDKLSIKDLKKFFETTRLESDQLEFKSINSNGNLNEKFSAINKSVCAFLNSSGGLLIWGAPIGSKVENKNEKIFTGELTFFNNVIEKDFVVSKISDSIIPLPNNIRVNILEDGNSSLAIIEIDNSEYAPHQTLGIYYMRIDGQSKPAPHHYIEALFKKIKYPNIEMYFKIIQKEIYQNQYKIDFQFYFFNWSSLQNEENLSFRVVSSNGKFSLAEHNPLSYRLNGSEYYNDSLQSVFSYGEPILVNETLLFDTYAITKDDYKTTLHVNFGGKFSPRKTSKYILDFTNFYSNNPDHLIISKDENQLIKDKHDTMGLNKESIINSMLK